MGAGDIGWGWEGREQKTANAPWDWRICYEKISYSHYDTTKLKLRLEYSTWNISTERLSSMPEMELVVGAKDVLLSLHTYNMGQVE